MINIPILIQQEEEKKKQEKEVQLPLYIEENILEPIDNEEKKEKPVIIVISVY